jgi:hypothetical protein
VSEPVAQGTSSNGASAAGAYGDESAGSISALAAGRPEFVVGAAFAGGLVLAILARRLAR